MTVARLKRAEPVTHRNIGEVWAPVVRDARSEDTVSPRALRVLLTRAELCGRRLPGRIDGGDVDLVARMLEAQELGRNAGYWIILVRNVGEG